MLHEHTPEVVVTDERPRGPWGPADGEDRRCEHEQSELTQGSLTTKEQ